MHLDKLKRWQWALIGVILGAIIGGMRGYMADMNPDTGIDESLTQIAFERDLLKENYKHERPFFKDMVIRQWRGREVLFGIYYLPRVERETGPDSKPHFVTKVYERTFRFLPDEPYKPTHRFPGISGSNLTLRGFLDQVIKDNPDAHISYANAWWYQPGMQLKLWTAGGLIVGWLIWPSIVNLITFGSLFRPKEPKEERASAAHSKAAAAAAPAVVSNDDVNAHIQSLEAELEGSLAAPSPSEGGEDASAPAIRPLTATSSDTPPPANAEPQAPREYAGEFYPVARPGGEDGDAHHGKTSDSPPRDQ